MPVQTILGIVALMAIYSEIQAPGLGFPAVVGIVAVGILVGSHYLIGLAQVWEIALLIIGIGLLLAEVFVIPGFGIAGIGGIICCLLSIFAMILPNAPGELPLPTTALDWSYLRGGMISLMLTILFSAVGIALLAKYLPHTPFLNRLVLSSSGTTEPDTSFTEDSPIRRIQPGDEGTVVGTCRPVGRVLFGDDLLDAVTEGGMIESGAKVRAIRRSGNCIVIEEVAEND
jgi:membrane-bound serine protease (ClpP class)